MALVTFFFSSIYTLLFQSLEILIMVNNVTDLRLLIIYSVIVYPEWNKVQHANTISGDNVL